MSTRRALVVDDDRAMLEVVGEALGSSGTMERVLDTVAHATVEATEAERAVVFLLEEGRLVPMASAGAAPGPLDDLAATARTVIEGKIPAAVTDADGRVRLGAPLF